jgi:N-acetylglutamate synthase-like GNAT family acetyltransferase
MKNTWKDFIAAYKYDVYIKRSIGRNEETFQTFLIVKEGSWVVYLKALSFTTKSSCMLLHASS